MKDKTDVILYEIVCVCGGQASLSASAVYHTMPTCMSYDHLPPDEFARGLRLWWVLEAAEKDPEYVGCKRVQGRTVAPGWGCCKCRVYNGLGRATCKKCEHPCCGLNPISKESPDEAQSD